MVPAIWEAQALDGDVQCARVRRATAATPSSKLTQQLVAVWAQKNVVCVASRVFCCLHVACVRPVLQLGPGPPIDDPAHPVSDDERWLHHRILLQQHQLRSVAGSADVDLLQRPVVRLQVHKGERRVGDDREGQRQAACEHGLPDVARLSSDGVDGNVGSKKLCMERLESGHLHTSWGSPGSAEVVQHGEFVGSEIDRMHEAGGFLVAVGEQRKREHTVLRDSELLQKSSAAPPSLNKSEPHSKGDSHGRDEG